MIYISRRKVSVNLPERTYMSDELTSIFDNSNNPAKPFVHEVLERDDTFRKTLQEWIFSDRFADVQTLLYQYFILEDDTGINDTLARTKNNASNTIRITYTPAYFEKNELQYLADAWQQKMLENNYKTYISDVRHFLRNDYVEIIERHYLKPKITFNDNPVLQQQFGNIIIEYRMLDEQPFDLQLQVHYYTGRNYSEAQSFDDLLHLLFI